jgi:hypothetical protein
MELYTRMRNFESDGAMMLVHLSVQWTVIDGKRDLDDEIARLKDTCQKHEDSGEVRFLQGWARSP